MQKIQIASVKCDYKDHQGKSIKLLCLNPDCKQQSAFCFKCSIKGHLQCRDFVKEPKQIEQELIDLKQLHTNLVQLSEQINQQFKTLLSKIEQLIKPITQYQQTPNLTNLNLIGSMLKQTSTTQKNIKENTESSLKSMTQLLSNYYSCNKQVIKQDCEVIHCNKQVIKQDCEVIHCNKMIKCDQEVIHCNKMIKCDQEVTQQVEQQEFLQIEELEILDQRIDSCCQNYIKSDYQEPAEQQQIYTSQIKNTQYQNQEKSSENLPIQKYQNQKNINKQELNQKITINDKVRRD